MTQILTLSFRLLTHHSDHAGDLGAEHYSALHSHLARRFDRPLLHNNTASTVLALCTIFIQCNYCTFAHNKIARNMLCVHTIALRPTYAYMPNFRSDTGLEILLQLRKSTARGSQVPESSFIGLPTSSSVANDANIVKKRKGLRL